MATEDRPQDDRLQATLKGFQTPAEIEEDDLHQGRAFNGHLVDARTLVFAITNEGHTLESARRRAFGVPYTKRAVIHGAVTEHYITYCREDVEATANLYVAAMDEYLRHPIVLQSTKAYSPPPSPRHICDRWGSAPSSIVRRISPPKCWGGRHPPSTGGGPSAASGSRPGRTGGLHLDVPDRRCPHGPLVASSHGITYRRQGRIPVVQELLDGVSIEQCFDQDLWSQLVGIAQITPDDDVLPCRARYGNDPSWNIGINPLTTRRARGSPSPT